MAFQIIDRRLNSRHKSAVNRQRFVQRYRKHIRKAVSDAFSERSITDVARGEKINIPRKDVSEPNFRHGAGGRQEHILPGNRDFMRGDKIARPPAGNGGSGEGSGDEAQSEQALDDFIFEISREEFMDFLFEDLALPDLVKKQLKHLDSYTLHKGGYSKQGIPARLNVLKSLRSAQARRLVFGGGTRREIKALEQELEELQAMFKGDDWDQGTRALTQPRMREIKQRLIELKQRLKLIPFIDELDMRYNNIIRQPTPASSAVMFCLMDVSGSMTQEIKDIAKRFFLLLYLFLKRNYHNTEVVFIRHHTQAREVDETEFFHARETGGTIVSSALSLMQDIAHKRYPGEAWNIYVAQASDGDNWPEDSPDCRRLLSEHILPIVQYYTYVEIQAGQPQALWNDFLAVQERFPKKMALQQIRSAADIYPVFRELFKADTP